MAIGSVSSISLPQRGVQKMFELLFLGLYLFQARGLPAWRELFFLSNLGT